jgi:hypothetical protein
MQGLIGDFFLTCTCTCLAILLLLSLDGAEQFRRILAKPGEEAIPMSLWIAVDRALIFTTAVAYWVPWILLAIGQIRRYQCYNTQFVVALLSGAHTVVRVLRKRVGTLFTVAHMHDKCGGEETAIVKRQKMLGRKLIDLFVDTFIAFFTVVSIPLSALVLDATVSSRLLLKTMAIGMTFCALGGTLFGIVARRKLQEKRRKVHARRTKLAMPSSVSGLSSVLQS